MLTKPIAYNTRDRQTRDYEDVVVQETSPTLSDGFAFAATLCYSLCLDFKCKHARRILCCIFFFFF